MAALAATPALASPLLPETTVPEETAPAAPASGAIQLERPAGEDQRTEERLAEIFANVPSLAGVTVSVSEGVVTLGGIAPDAAALARAETIAAGVEGVVTVENGITRDVSVDFEEGIGGLGDRLAGFVQMLPLLGLALLAGLLVVAIGYILSSLTFVWRRFAPNSFLVELIRSAIRFVFVVFGMLVALDMVGAGALMGAVLGGAGVIGIALGFAMRDMVENYVASLMLSLRQPFRANDYVVIDTHEGRVIRLTSRATILMTLDGNHLRIPNSAVFKATILNYTRNPQRRFDFALGVDADDDAEAAMQLGRETLQGLGFLLDDPPPEVRIEEVGDSNVVLRFFGWIDQRDADWYKARSRAIVACKQALEGAGFALPEPIYRLRFDQRTASLPFQNVAEATVSQAPAPEKPARTQPVEDADDVAPEDEVARMVEEERAAPAEGQEKDLLDPSRPVE